jgi:PAS domain S-box-containing protein
MRLFEFIRGHQEDILRDWDEFAATLLPDSETLDAAGLRDSAAEILNVIAEAMVSGQSATEQVQKSRGERKSAPQMHATAQEHATERLAQRLTLEQLIAEYRALRASVIRRWSERAVNDGMEDMADQTRFNEAVDECLAASVSWYDTRLRDLETKAREVDRAREREHEFRALSDFNPAGILVNQGGRFVYANKAAVSLLGEQFIGESPYELSEGAFHDSVRERIEAVEAGIAAPPIEQRWKKTNGEEVEVELEVARGPTPWQGRSAALVILRDITERKLAERALHQSARAKDQFLAILGHELRNPLAPLRTGLNILELAPRDPDLLDRIVPMMTRQLSHLVRMVDDLLDVSRVTQGTIALRTDTIDINVAVVAAIEQVRSLIDGPDHRLILELSSDRLPVYGDFERLTQVVANLLSNAAKYTDPGGTITVTTGREHGTVYISVRDTGLGIGTLDFGKVFELFGKVAEHQRRDGGGGLGVGLALSRQLVQMHGGTIEVKSEGAGRGSEFLVQLPLCSLEHEASAGGGLAAIRDDRARRILVVDDNLDAAESLRILLELGGHAVEAVHSGAAALEAVERLKPDVVLLDLGLPDMSGIEVGRRIRALPNGEAVHLIAVTGWGQDEDRDLTKEAGFDDHRTKPVDAAELMSMLAGLDQR